jgi:hypothetical protein
MAKNWRGWRLITIDEQRFRWAVEFNHPSEKFSSAYAESGDSWNPDRLLVRPELLPSNLLTVNWPACHGPLVLPRVVRACIEAALQGGWLGQQSNLCLDGTILSSDLESLFDKT